MYDMSGESKPRQFYGVVVVGERGQIVIPAEAREELQIKAGDKMVVLGAHDRGVVLMKAEKLRDFAEKVLKDI